VDDPTWADPRDEMKELIRDGDIATEKGEGPEKPITARLA
jgi:hypothetical protein